MPRPPAFASCSAPATSSARGRARTSSPARTDSLRVTPRFIVGADGARSAVAKDLGLDRNRHLLIGAEEVWAVPARVAAAPGQEPTFHCVLDPSARARLPRLVGERRRARPRGRRGLRTPLPRGDAQRARRVRGRPARTRGRRATGRDRAARRTDPGRRTAAHHQQRVRPARRRRGRRGLPAHRGRTRPVPAAIAAGVRGARPRAARRAARRARELRRREPAGEVPGAAWDFGAGCPSCARAASRRWGSRRCALRWGGRRRAPSCSRIGRFRMRRPR